MRVAVIDLGSNSVRFDIYQIYGDLNYTKIYSEKLMIKLGQDVFANGFLSNRSIKNTSEVFKHFKTISKQLFIDKTYAYATAAVRHASNKDQFINKVFKASEIKLVELSGIQEAKIIYNGFIQNLKKPIPSSFLCIDIGGGSTEISLCANKKTYHHSIPFGSSLIKETFLSSSTPNKKELPHLKSAVVKYLSTHLKSWPKEKTSQSFGSSGTVKGITKVLNKGHYLNKSFTRASLNKLIQKTSLLDHEKLKQFPYMEEKRVDMFVGGNVLLNEILNHFNCPKLYYTDIALKEGLLNQVISKQKLNYAIFPNLKRETAFFYKHSLAEKDQSLFQSLKRFIKKVFPNNTILSRQTALAVYFSLLLNQKKLNYSFSEYQNLIQSYPYYSSKSDQNAILLICKLMLEHDIQSVSQSQQPNFQKAATLTKFMAWFSKQDPQWIKKYSFKNRIFELKNPSNNFLQQKQLDQIKKSFEELFDLRIKLL